MSDKCKIIYIDDDGSVQFTNFFDNINSEFEEMQEPKMELEFLNVSEKTEEYLFSEITQKNIHGIILDFDMSQSNKISNGYDIWKKIKVINPDFPIVILTSKRSDIHFKNEKNNFYEKYNPNDINSLMQDLTNQIKSNLSIIDRKENILEEIKSDGAYSLDKQLLENDIENQFSIARKKLSDTDFDKFSKLLDKAYELIKEYKND